MEYRVKLIPCMILFGCILIVMPWDKVNGHYVNDTIKTFRMIDKDFRVFQRTGKRVSGRDGRSLISFDTRNDNIQVGLEFSVPFITIPVKKSVESMKSWASKSSTFITDPIMNVNGAALALTGMVALGGLATTYFWKSAVKDQLFYSNNNFDHYPYGRHFDTNEFGNDGSIFTRFTDQIEHTFNQNNIDVMICLQRFMCTMARDAAKNVAKGHGTSIEKIVDGITGTTLLKRLTAGTAINDAIAAGQRFDDCDHKFSECKMKSKGLEPFFEFFSHSIH